VNVGNKPPVGISGLYTKHITPPGASRAEKTSGDKTNAIQDQIEMSAEALALKKAAEAALAADEVRWEVVQRIRASLARGDYEVPLDELAQRLIADV